MARSEAAGVSPPNTHSLWLHGTDARSFRQVAGKGRTEGFALKEAQATDCGHKGAGLRVLGPSGSAAQSSEAQPPRVPSSSGLSSCDTLAPRISRFQSRTNVESIDSSRWEKPTRRVHHLPPPPRFRHLFLFFFSFSATSGARFPPRCNLPILSDRGRKDIASPTNRRTKR